MVNPKSYVWGTGRRKSSVARVRIAPGEGRFVVNKKEWRDYFPTRAARVAAAQPLKLTATEATYDVFVNVSGGGVQGQADAVRHGLARALASADTAYEAALRSRKPGKKSARRR